MRVKHCRIRIPCLRRQRWQLYHMSTFFKIRAFDFIFIIPFKIQILFQTIKFIWTCLSCLRNDILYQFLPIFNLATIKIDWIIGAPCLMLWIIYMCKLVLLHVEDHIGPMHFNLSLLLPEHFSPLVPHLLLIQSNLSFDVIFLFLFTFQSNLF